MAAMGNREQLEGLEKVEKEAARRHRLRSWALPLLGIAGFLLIWEVFSRAGTTTLPGPVQTLRESWTFVAHPFFDNGPNDKGLGFHILASLGRVAVGYLSAALVGVGLGIVAGRYLDMHKTLDPIFQVLRTIPPLAWLPLSLATFNKSGPAAVFVIFITALWPILINTTVGVMRIPAEYENIARIYQLRRTRYFFLILLPAAAPYIFTGLRISIGMAWLAIVAAEMLTGGVGIGFFIWDSWNSSKLSDLIVAVVYVGMVGFLLDRMMAKAASFFGVKTD